MNEKSNSLQQTRMLFKISKTYKWNSEFGFNSPICHLLCHGLPPSDLFRGKAPHESIGELNDSGGGVGLLLTLLLLGCGAREFFLQARQFFLEPLKGKNVLNLLKNRLFLSMQTVKLIFLVISGFKCLYSNTSRQWHNFKFFDSITNIHCF